TRSGAAGPPDRAGRRRRPPAGRRRGAGSRLPETEEYGPAAEGGFLPRQGARPPPAPGRSCPPPARVWGGPPSLASRRILRLPDGCADVVTCSQSLHWMDPEPTFAEVARILRSGGVFAAYDCDWPPTVHWEAEVAYQETIRRAEAIGRERGFFSGVRRWDKTE